MKIYIIRLYRHLLVEEKALWKSSTIWLSMLLTSMPDILTYVQANFPSIQDYLPHALQDPVMRVVGVAVFLCRMKSLIKLPQQAQP